MAERDVILKRFAGGSTWDILYPKTKALNVDGLGTAGLVNLNSNNRFVTDAEKTAWNNKSNFSGNYNDLTNIPKNRVELLRARSGVDNLTIHNNATVTGVGSQLNLGDTIMFEVLNTGAITAATPKILTATVSVSSNSASELRSVTFTTWTGSVMKVFSLSVALISAALTFGNMNVMQMSKSGTDMNITNSTWTAYIGRIWKVDGSVI